MLALIVFSVGYFWILQIYLLGAIKVQLYSAGIIAADLQVSV